MLNSAELMQIVLTNTLGLSILVEVIKSAGVMFIHTNGASPCSNSEKQRMRESKQCFAFIQGTGLETILSDYDLAYDPDNLRRCFYTTFKLRNML